MDGRGGGAFGRQFGHDFFAGGGNSTATEENDASRALFHQPARNCEPQASMTTRDQVSGIGSRTRQPIRGIFWVCPRKEKHKFSQGFAPRPITQNPFVVPDRERIWRARRYEWPHAQTDV